MSHLPGQLTRQKMAYRAGWEQQVKRRIVTGTVYDGQAAEAARRCEETVGVELARLPEFRHASVGGDGDRTRFVVVTVWQRFPEPEVRRGLLRGFEERMRDIRPGPLAVAEFDLLATVG